MPPLICWQSYRLLVLLWVLLLWIRLLPHLLTWHVPAALRAPEGRYVSKFTDLWIASVCGQHGGAEASVAC